uniref:IF rod domain-containing protein n=1 Tax=Spongospora subterranea TaxID=70186 RepID=A0A0H5R4D7_9EUKA|eukprot:CRZ09003.1 hypothetical protein [Spongospora subterranea]
MATNVNVEESPIRIHPEVERKNLEELNGRLQQYIMKQRAKDASREAFEKDVVAIQQQARVAIHANTKKYEEQLRQMRQQRDEHASAREELQVRVARQEATVTRLKDQIAEEKKFQSDLNGRLSSLSSQLEAANAQVQRLQEQLRKTEHNFKSAESAGRAAEEQLIEARDAADQYSHEASSLRAKLKSFEQDMTINAKASEAEISALKAKIEQLSAQVTITEDSCRQEFASQLSSIVEDYRKQCNDDKTRITRELKSHFVPKLAELRAAYEESCQHESELREINVTVTEQVNQLKKDNQTLAEMKSLHEKRIAELSEELDTERNVTHNDAIAAKDKEIEKLRHTCQRLETDFDDLMDVKIQLALTIEKYRELLSEEEHRLGLETPGRKRKRSKRSLPAPQTPALKLWVNDEVENCLFVKNTSDKIVNLNGMILQSGSFSFDFPDDAYVGGQCEVCIWIGETSNSLEASSEDRTNISWEGVNPEDLTAAPMQLIDQNGTVIDQFEVETISAGDDKNACLLM